MKHIMQQQTNEAHYATANKWSTLCTRKQMKHIKQSQTIEENYETAKNKANCATTNK